MATAMDVTETDREVAGPKMAEIAPPAETNGEAVLSKMTGPAKQGAHAKSEGQRCARGGSMQAILRIYRAIKRGLDETHLP